MPERTGTVDLLALAEAPGGDWVEMTIPGSAPPVRLLRLHLDRTTKASVSLVRFPAGWTRPGTGNYTSGEEFVVLDGDLRVSGVVHLPGDPAYVPPGGERTDSTSTDGAVALAWFSGPPTWHDVVSTGPLVPGRRSGPVAPGPFRARHPGVPGESAVLATCPPGPVATDTDLLSLSTSIWAYVPADQAPPPLAGTLLVRSWQ